MGNTLLYPNLAKAAAVSDVDKMTLNYNDKNKNNNNNTLFYERRKDNQFAYSIQFPSQFDGPGNKPVKTHLDEVNFQSNVWNGYQFGITIDPVRIQSLSQFGTPPEVAAKVVLAELKRDGIMEVTLMKDPIVSSSSSSSLFSSDSNNNKNLNNSNDENDVSYNDYYLLNYKSVGKRGDKRFVTKFYIQNQMLYALTVQCKEANYESVETELLNAVDSFRVLSPLK